MSNKFLEKIAEEATKTVKVQRYSDASGAPMVDKKLAAQGSLIGAVANHIVPGAGLIANSVRHSYTGRDLKGAAREEGRAMLTGGAGSIVGGIAGKVLSGSRRGAAIGSMAGLVAGSYHGRLKSIRNQINEGRLEGVENTKKSQNK